MIYYLEWKKALKPNQTKKIHIEKRKQEKNEGFEMSICVFIQINMQWLHVMDLYIFGVLEISEMEDYNSLKKNTQNTYIYGIQQKHF